MKKNMQEKNIPAEKLPVKRQPTTAREENFISPPPFLYLLFSLIIETCPHIFLLSFGEVRIPAGTTPKGQVFLLAQQCERRKKNVQKIKILSFSFETFASSFGESLGPRIKNAFPETFFLTLLRHLLTEFFFSRLNYSR